MNLRRYKGDGKKYPYRADRKLAQVVNMSMALGRPLLVKGPPGCGKTQLAHAIAGELGLPFYKWYVKSTSRARDGLYSIDMVRRLADAQLDPVRAQSLTNYIDFGPLGKALKGGAESVVLIDEIDKADIDFPNDLLRELEEKTFTIEELKGQLTKEEEAEGWSVTYKSETPPVVVITSNDEKELPDAFLRRCLFYYIEFPDSEQLAEIVRLNTRELELEERLAALAIGRLNEIRGLDADAFRKAPATSELLDWVKILHHWKVRPERLASGRKLTELPYWEVLFKHQQDVQQVQRLSEGGA
ncbi:MAG TPA: MoxR family ATPase [Pyrinomonadaceae bacterium]|jgi:MoxR-like ATPase